MNSTSTMTADFANDDKGEAGTCKPRIGANVGTFNSAIINAIKEIYREDQVKILARWLSLSLKTAKNRLLGQRDFTVEELGALISSEHGYRVISAIMAEASSRPGYRKPQWWDLCSVLMDAADIRRMQLLADRRIAKTIESAIDANKHLAAAIQRAETLAVHDADFHSGHLDALRSMRRVPDSSLASSKRKR